MIKFLFKFSLIQVDLRIQLYFIEVFKAFVDFLKEFLSFKKTSPFQTKNDR